MRKLTFILASMVLSVVTSFSQNDKNNQEKSLNHEWKQAMEQVEKTLQDIELPEIDVDQIMDEVKAAMPTREELDSYQEVVTDAVRELKKVDLRELERALNQLGDQLEDILEEQLDGKGREKSKEEKYRKI